MVLKERSIVATATMDGVQICIKLKWDRQYKLFVFDGIWVVRKDGDKIIDCEIRVEGDVFQVIEEECRKFVGAIELEVDFELRY